VRHGPEFASRTSQPGVLTCPPMWSLRGTSLISASRREMRYCLARGRSAGPRDRFEEVLKRTHGGLIVE
jgi:hypothetical protein